MTAPKIAKKILVVCHDGGGAQIVSAYIRKNKKVANFYCLVTGPAINIFKNKNLEKCIISANEINEEVIKKIDLIILGTSWADESWKSYIKIGKKNKIKTAAYLEHWVNYRERFGYPNKNWQKNLPDEIWVGDKFAHNLAKKYFSKVVKIIFVPNQYFKDLHKEYSVQNHDWGLRNILFLSEPVSRCIKASAKKVKAFNLEDYILEKLLLFLKSKKFAGKIIVRLHPSEVVDKYKHIQDRFKKELQIIQSNSLSLTADFAKTKIVVGMESVALVAASICGKEVYSFMPGVKKKFSLPFKQIMQIRKIKDLNKISL